MNFSVLKSKTFWGSVLVAVGHIAFAPDSTARTQAIVEGVGLVWTAIGVRSAIAKNGNGQ